MIIRSEGVMKLQDIKARTPEQKMAVENCILLCRSGSHLYGTNTATSDEDYMGVFIPPKPYVLGKKRIEQVEFNTNPSDSGKRNSQEDLDNTLFSIDKWTTMCANNNPNRLELFFSPKNCILHITDLGKRLMESYPLFISLKSYHSFRGYSHAQMARLKLKSGNNNGRIDLIEKYGYDTKMASHNIRLYIECIQLLKEHAITFPLKENNLLIDIKQGKMSYDDFIKKSEQLSALAEAVYASSTLPHSPNHEGISELQQGLYEDFWDQNKS